MVSREVMGISSEEIDSFCFFEVLLFSDVSSVLNDNEICRQGMIRVLFSIKSGNCEPKIQITT